MASAAKLTTEQAWDRYELDLHSAPSPWIVEETLQSHLLLEVLPSRFPQSTWLEGSALDDYRWGRSVALVDGVQPWYSCLVFLTGETSHHSD